ncbi:hypothetical protein BDM02DRAFT_3172684 [Thelephora ganbajun]|uniref:Uncharacterized protein n=1 Tax=Thelephora ganbajun TaxID=370292 RepID=A0ACB6Z8C5_THEGA|nr:hypothetical protein BDM02DRAFT_3172684 [Thelephora ganbajun]
MELAFIREEGLQPSCACMDKVFAEVSHYFGLVICKHFTSAMSSTSLLQVFYPQLPLLSSYRSSLELSSPDMVHKRRQSLQALFIPPFLLSSATNRSRSHSETGKSQLVAINSPTTPTTTTTVSQDSPQLDPFSQALYSFATTDNVVSLDSSYSDLLDTDPFANLSTPPTNQDKPLPQPPSHSVLPASTIPRSPLSPAELRAHPLPTAGIKYASATTPSSPITGALHLPPSPVRPAYTKPVFKSTPSLPSLRSLSQGQYLPTRKVS